MDRQSIIGFVLIAVLITGWMMYNSSQTQTPQPQKKSETTQSGNSAVSKGGGTTTPNASQPSAKSESSQTFINQPPSKLEQFVKVETDNYIAYISSKGMTIAKWELKKYNAWFGKPAQLIKSGERELSISYTGQNGKKTDTRWYDFTFKNVGSGLKVQGNQSSVLTAQLDLGNGAIIERTMTFRGNTYDVAMGIKMVNMDNILPNTQRWFDISWNSNKDLTSGLQYQENNSADESGNASVFASLNGSLDELKADVYNERKQIHPTGTVDFIGEKKKYFISALINKNANKDADVFLEGIRYGAEGNGYTENYTYTYRVPYKGGIQNSEFDLYLGPLDYDILKGYGLESTVSLGWKWLVRPISVYIMLPIFNFIHNFIPNFGVSIIVFSILMKLLLMPLSKGQMESAKKMKALQPEIEKLRAKHGDDVTGMQQAQMKLFGEYGINPMGGCLPLLLQMPILYSLYSVLTSNIQMRQAIFFSGIDLSIPDHIIHLPFSIFGITALSGMALIMGVTMFVQQKMTVTDPNQKAMVMMMPVMMTFMFSNLPSGLNLYYLVFNFLGIAQQIWMTKFSSKQYTIEDLRKMPKKESWLQKRMRLAQELAESQGRTLPDNPYFQKNGDSKKQSSKGKRK